MEEVIEFHTRTVSFPCVVTLERETNGGMHAIRIC